MTSIFFDPAQFGAPSTPESREQLIVNGRYYLPPLNDPTGKRRSLQRVTNFIKQLSDTGGLERWKLRMAVIGLARDERRYDLATSLDPDTERGKRELDQLIEECIDLGQAGPSGGNITGTALHNYTDDVPGSYPIRVRDKWVPKVENYQRALHDKGLRVVPGLSERLVVSERYGTCGRLDDVYEDPFGTLRVGDRKSQKEFRTWWEVGAQLALYQLSEAMWNEETSSWEDMPKLADDYAHVAWMPLQHPDQRDGVTIYDLPLEGPREILGYCARVRELRTAARKWGAERPDLDEFARLARDIRDAETHDDLMKLNIGLTGSDSLRVMAADRWEEIQAAMDAELPRGDLLVPGLPGVVLTDVPIPADVHPDNVVRVTSETSANFSNDETTLTITGTHDVMTELVSQADADFECRFDGKLASQHPVYTPGQFHCTSPQPRPERAYAVAERLLNHIAPQRLTAQGQVDAASIGFDPALFGPPSQDATFPADQDGVPGSDADAERPGGLKSGRPALTPVATAPFTNAHNHGATVVELPEPQCCNIVDHKSCLMMGADNCSCPKHCPAEPALGVEVSPGVVLENGRGVTLDELNAMVGTTSVTVDDDGSEGSAEHLALVVDRTSPSYLDALDGVSIKILKEVVTRAHNSTSSRGRVRLLNDLQKKYAKYAEALEPALLAEWLAIDGETGWDDTIGAVVKNTESSKARARHANDAGPITLTQFLATKGEGAPAPKEGSAAPAQGGDEVQLKDSVDISKALTLPRAREIEAAVERFVDEVAEIRRPYLGLSEGEHAGKHSMLRLIELAKDARNGAERAKVFHEITRRRAWTGAIAAEINQHYLDNGYAVEDFDPYFEAVALPTGMTVALPHAEPVTGTASKVIMMDNGHLSPTGPAQGWIDGPDWLSTSPEEAIRLLDDASDFAQFQLLWQSLNTTPCWNDGSVQEAVMRNMIRLK